MFPEISTGRANSFTFYNVRVDKLNLEFYQNLYIILMWQGLQGGLLSPPYP